MSIAWLNTVDQQCLQEYGKIQLIKTAETIRNSQQPVVLAVGAARLPIVVSIDSDLQNQTIEYVRSSFLLASDHLSFEVGVLSLQRRMLKKRRNKHSGKSAGSL